MMDLMLQYRACGAETREDYLRLLANENGLPIAEVQQAAEHFGSSEEFSSLVTWCEGETLPYPPRF